MFGQTVTASGDTMSQVRNRRACEPKTLGRHGHRVRRRLRRPAVPLQRQELRQRPPVVHRPRAVPADPGSLAGLLTTDHPNGAPFTTYPHLIRLLMDRASATTCLATLPKAAREHVGPPGDQTRVHAAGDRHPDPRRAGATSRHRPPPRASGPRRRSPTSRSTSATTTTSGCSPRPAGAEGRPPWSATARSSRPICGATHVVRPGFDGAIEPRVARFFADHRDLRLGIFELADGEIEDGGRGRVVVQDCRR